MIDIDILSSEENISVQDLKKVLVDKKTSVIDVRPEIEYQMCKLPNTINFPFSSIIKTKGFKELENKIQNHQNGLHFT